MQETESDRTTFAKEKRDFYRQSLWLIFAAFTAGALMWLVHFLNKFLPKEEYGTLGTLMTSIILVPSIPLQMVFAQQTAAALASGRPRQLAGMLRLVLACISSTWLVLALAVVLLQDTILIRWKIANPAALWVTLAVILVALWTPPFAGLLQGSQRFKWLGWVMILQGVGRVGGAGILVIVLGFLSAGVMAGVLIGCLIGLVLVMWCSRDLWLMRGDPFNRNQFLRQVIPLALGFSAYQFLLSADTIFVNAFFGREETAYYFTAGTLSRALVWAVGPLVAVMFPKIVRSSIRAENNNLLAITLVGTGVLVAVGAVALWLLGPVVIRLVYNPTYVAPTLAILPWYAAAMVPLCLASVMVNNLLAKSDFRVIPWLLVLAVGYALVLIEYHPNVVVVLQWLGVFCLLLFLVCAWLTWVGKSPPKPASHSST